MEPSVLLKELNNLREIGSIMFRCAEVEEVIKEAFRRIEEKLHPQVFSIFLFSKDGYIERIAIYGKDKNGIDIEKDWLPNEKYEPGESFSGKAAAPKPGHFYGEPNWSNSLEQDIEKLTKGNVYAEKLGFLKCGISVPLNGTHRTFGTLEVINKLDPQSRKPNNNLVFSEEEVYWLTIIGAHVAIAISRLRNKEEDKIFAKISCLLADPNNEQTPSEDVYSSIAKQLVGPLMPYKACILRVTDDLYGLYIIGKACTDDISFDGKDEDWRIIGEGIVGEVFATGIYKEVEEIELNKSNFKSIEWIEYNKLKSFICLPLLIEGKAIGTISLFTGYVHKFSNGEIDFLKNVSFLLAEYRERIDRAKNNRERESAVRTHPEEGNIPIKNIRQAVKKALSK